MKKITTSLLLVSTIAVLAPVAPAQALNTVNAGSRVTAPVTPPAAGVNGAAQGAAASSTTIRPPITNPVAGGAAGNAQAGTNVSGSKATGLNANATTNASAEGQANGLAVAGVATTSTAGMADTVKSIREANYAMRDSVTADVQARLEASSELVAGFRARADASGDKARRALGEALADVRKQEKQVRASLKACAKATSEASWGEAQSALAHDYNAYVLAMAHAEAVAQSSEQASVTSKP